MMNFFSPYKATAKEKFKNTGSFRIVSYTGTTPTLQMGGRILTGISPKANGFASVSINAQKIGAPPVMQSSNFSKYTFVKEAIVIHYPKVYDTVQRLRESLQSNIITPVAERYGELKQLNAEMSGETNQSLQEAMALSQLRHEETANTLLSIIDYIETATREFERRDNQIAASIDQKEGL